MLSLKAIPAVIRLIRYKYVIANYTETTSATSDSGAGFTFITVVLFGFAGTAPYDVERMPVQAVLPEIVMFRYFSHDFRFYVNRFCYVYNYYYQLHYAGRHKPVHPFTGVRPCSLWPGNTPAFVMVHTRYESGGSPFLSRAF